MNNKSNIKRDRGIFFWVIIIILMFITFMAIIFPAITGGSIGFSQNKDIVSIPTVTTVVTSAKDGSVHNMEAKFSIELEDSAHSDVNSATFQGYITEIVSTLDYDKINADGADIYIKSSIENGLSAYMDPADIKKIYITELQSGDAYIRSDDPTSDSPGLDVLRGLFQGIE